MSRQQSSFHLLLADVSLTGFKVKHNALLLLIHLFVRSTSLSGKEQPLLDGGQRVSLQDLAKYLQHLAARN